MEQNLLTSSQSILHVYTLVFASRLLMICRQGSFVEYSVFGKETTVDLTIIPDAKGTVRHWLTHAKYNLIFLGFFDAMSSFG